MQSNAKCRGYKRHRARLMPRRAGPDALELVLHDNLISQQQREWLERPENYLRPIRIREDLAASGGCR